MTAWINELEKINMFKSEEIEISFKEFLITKELGIGAVLPLFRLLVTGKAMGPSMFEIASFLGKEECVLRMNNGIIKLS
jgi:glutamyl-tRNA synthetase